MPIAGDWNGATAGASAVLGPSEAEGDALQATISSQADLQPMPVDAVWEWPSGIFSERRERLNNVDAAITYLAGSRLSLADLNTIFPDHDGASDGRFVALTPPDDVESAKLDSAASLPAADPRALDEIDLLSLVEQEFGHSLGLQDLDLLSDGLLSRLP
jgi:hypothetical protein